MKPASQNLKVWIEISRAAAIHNIKTIRGLLDASVELWAVVKSNAYGHGIYTYTKIINDYVDGFCVDSVAEAKTLRREDITKPILVLGPTLPGLLEETFNDKIAISISNPEALIELVRLMPNPAKRPEIHLKIDTGMHRQGFFVKDLKSVINYIKKNQIKITGLFSHLASAKDLNYPTYCELQFSEFKKAQELFQKNGFENLKCHLSATGGLIIDKKYHLNAVRSGIGLYGIYPSREIETQVKDKIKLEPVLSWHALISEVKNIKAGEYIGYDLVEKVNRKTKLAIVPIGYWHGLPWVLSQKGEVLINGKRAKILGRVTMDLIMVDATGISCKVGDKATIIGTQGSQTISARDMAMLASTSPYEIITRINPLIERRII